MVEIVVIMIVMALVGSIFWVLPSPLQRAKAKLRSQAIQSGFSVKFSDYEYSREVEGDYYAEKLICYSYLDKDAPSKKDFGLFLLKKRRGADLYWSKEHCRNFDDDKVQDVIDMLDAGLSNVIYGVAFTATGYRFYWLEEIKSVALDQIITEIKKIRGLVEEVASK